MTHQDNVLWLQCWRDQRTEFTLATTNPLLIRFWPGLGLAKGSRIFVPLCGKSLDLLWLAEQGHEVIGVELSPVAVRAFFKDHKLTATRRKLGAFTLWEHGRIHILCGDYFALSQALLGRIDMVYDHTALTALPEHLRPRYVAQLSRIIPCAAPIFLLTTEDTDPLAHPSLALAIDGEINALYAAHFAITLAHVESVFETNPESPDSAPICVQYKVYQLVAKPLLGDTLGVA